VGKMHYKEENGKKRKEKDYASRNHGSRRRRWSQYCENMLFVVEKNEQLVQKKYDRIRQETLLGFETKDCASMNKKRNIL
jgi:hypothetical protein